MPKRREPSAIEVIEAVLRDRFPTLHLIEQSGQLTVRGRFPVISEGIVIDNYLVEITVPSDFPNSVPLLKELGGRIPKISDRHVYTGEYLCLFLPDERWKYWPRGLGFLEFLQGPVTDYFLSQTYFERTGQWPFGERRHGRNGIADYYAEELGTTDIKVIIACLEYLGKKHIKGHWRCYCGSGKQMRQCHFQTMQELRHKIDMRTARNSLSYFKKQT